MVQGNGAYVILHATAGMNMRRMKSRIAIALALWLAVGGPSSVEGGHAASASSAANSAAVPVPTVVAQLSPRGGVRAPAGSVSAADFGAIGDGATDDTASLQRALNTGRAVFLLPGKSYAVTSPLKVPANGGIASDGTGEIFARASGFTNTDPTAAGRYRPTSTVIDASGMTTIPYTPNRNVTFRAFKLRFESTEGRSVDGIMARNVDGLVIDGVEISGFPAGVGIRLSSIVGESSVTHNRIRDFSSNTDFSKTYPGGRAQITGIEVDNDRINGVYSKGIVISDNQIMNLTVGPIFLAAHGFETDGINIHGGSGHRVERNRIQNTGEGIDTFASSGTIRNNVVTDSYLFGIKVIHGASGNSITGNTITRSGLAGVIVAGSASAQFTEKNTISNNTITDIDPHGVYAASTTSCIQVSAKDGTARNNVFSGNTLDPGRNGKWAIDLAHDTGVGNSFPNNRFVRSGTQGRVVERAGSATKPSR
jgi:parallel beta-helix repeat protein